MFATYLFVLSVVPLLLLLLLLMLLLFGIVRVYTENWNGFCTDNSTDNGGGAFSYENTEGVYHIYRFNSDSMLDLIFFYSIIYTLRLFHAFRLLDSIARDKKLWKNGNTFYQVNLNWSLPKKPMIRVCVLTGLDEMRWPQCIRMSSVFSLDLFVFTYFSAYFLFASKKRIDFVSHFFAKSQFLIVDRWTSTQHWISWIYQ